MASRIDKTHPACLGPLTAVDSVDAKDVHPAVLKVTEQGIGSSEKEAKQEKALTTEKSNEQQVEQDEHKNEIPTAKEQDEKSMGLGKKMDISSTYIWKSLLEEERLVYNPKKRLSYASPFTVFSLCWCPDGTIIAGGGSGATNTGMDGGAVICRVEEVQEDGKAKASEKAKPLGLRMVGYLSTGNEMVISIAAHPSDAIVAIGSDDKLLLCDYTKSSLTMRNAVATNCTNKDDPAITAICFTPSGSLVAAGGTDCCIRLYRFPSLQLYSSLSHPEHRHDHPVASLSFSRDGRWLASTASRSNDVCKVWAASDAAAQQEAETHAPGTLVQSLRLKLKDPKGKPVSSLCRCCVFNTGSPGADVQPPEFLFTLNAASSKGPGYLVQWDPATWKVLRKVQVSKRAAYNLCVASDGLLLGVSDTRGNIMVYDALTLSKRNSAPKVHSLAVTCLDFAPNSDFLLTGSADKSFHLLPTKAPTSVTKNIFLLLLNAIIVLSLLHYLQPSLLATLSSHAGL